MLKENGNSATMRNASDFALLLPMLMCKTVGRNFGECVRIVYHSVVQHARSAADEIRAVLQGVSASSAELQAIVLTPNADAGGESIREVLSKQRAGFRVFDHLSRFDYIQWLANCDVILGNSSSGIIEAASFGVPVINNGDRQRGRERSTNVIDVPVDTAAIGQALDAALADGRLTVENVYGDGRAGERICSLLETLPISQDLLLKLNAY